MALDDKIKQIRELRRRSQTFLKERTNLLRPFYNAKQQAFSYSIQNDGNLDTGSHLTSTATCILLLKQWGQLSSVVENLDALKDALIKAEWKSAGLDVNNAYTLSVLLPALYELDVGPENPKIQDAIGLLKNKISKGRGGVSLFDDAGIATNSGFLTWWSLVSLEKYDQNLYESQEFEQAINWAEREVFKQISFFHADEPDRRNIYQLAFAWAICERCPEQSPLTGKVSEHILEIIFQDQKENGIWPLYFPLFNFPLAGSAYVYHFELLLAVLWTIHSKVFLLEKYLDNIERILNWVESRKVDFCGVTGWPITTDPQRRFRPISWATAEILHSLCLIDQYLASIQRELIFDNLTYLQDGSKLNSINLSKVIDVEVRPDSHNVYSVKEILKTHIIDPVIRNKRTLAGIKEPIALSTILFGPPGTSKTTLARAVASELGWRILEIDPSHFALSGSSTIESRVIQVLSLLEGIFDSVILFDEIDELVRERTNESSDRIGRMWTTLMLPRLSQLRDSAKAVIFVATNHIEFFDDAARRPGRFDMVVPVGPPKICDEKFHLLARKLNQSIHTIKEWWDGLSDDHSRTCFKHMLYGEIGILVRAMGKEMTFDSFQRALNEIYDSIFLHQKRGPTKQWDEFSENARNFTRLLP